ncbi:carbohydrate ABC transporter permease [Actinomadura citrea]|jgi:multiple sugar transport system permease protein|uniref:Multiple sugar transport system permease protein n=1 Tax=Actinomadura citrea TaxID=46158 RepID=A0A7Y9GLL0_9ACTN|nr:carbohydrate ABC transporter permease [Actinomadura citrea]NYE17615.1 multiple sugar transport system permease protein [Actinomadura citrea]GGT60553.1 sugar ABC transporter permease [Actinomadura citrea]
MAASRTAARTGRLTLPVLLVLTAIVTITPFAAMVLVAFAPESGQTFPDALLPDKITLANFEHVLSSSDVPRWTLNSLIFSFVSVVLILLFASMAGYAFAKKRFPGRDALFWALLATLMVPFQATLIPSYILVSRLNGVDTYWGMIVPTLANVQAIFLMRQFIVQLPDELFEAAEMDGASEWRIFTTIVLPLVRPALATLGVFVFLWHWNDFLWPLVIGQSGEMQTLTVGLATLQSENVPINQIMAGATITVVPSLLVFGLLQRYLTDSIAMTGLKG